MVAMFQLGPETFFVCGVKCFFRRFCGNPPTDWFVDMISTSEKTSQKYEQQFKSLKAFHHTGLVNKDPYNGL